VSPTQDLFIDYLKQQFRFDHLAQARLGDSMHIHAYSLAHEQTGNTRLELRERLSTDANGIALCLGLQAEANVELTNIISQLESKISTETLLPVGQQ
jgi:hypothetical protein